MLKLARQSKALQEGISKLIEEVKCLSQYKVNIDEEFLHPDQTLDEGGVFLGSTLMLRCLYVEKINQNVPENYAPGDCLFELHESEFRDRDLVIGKGPEVGLRLLDREARFNFSEENELLGAD